MGIVKKYIMYWGFYKNYITIICYKSVTKLLLYYYILFMQIEQLEQNPLLFLSTFILFFTNKIICITFLLKEFYLFIIHVNYFITNIHYTFVMGCNHNSGIHLLLQAL